MIELISSSSTISQPQKTQLKVGFLHKYKLESYRSFLIIGSIGILLQSSCCRRYEMQIGGGCLIVCFVFSAPRPYKSTHKIGDHPVISGVISVLKISHIFFLTFLFTKLAPVSRFTSRFWSHKKNVCRMRPPFQHFLTTF